MNEMHSALYFGEVMHQRVRPRRHRLCYRVFFTFVDVDELAFGSARGVHPEHDELGSLVVVGADGVDGVQRDLGERAGRHVALSVRALLPVVDAAFDHVRELLAGVAVRRKLERRWQLDEARHDLEVGG